MARSAPDGEPALVLKDSLYVEAAPREGDWYKIQVPQIWDFETIDEAGSKRKELTKGNSIVDPTGKRIGRVLADYKLKDQDCSRSRTTTRYVWTG